MKHNEDETLSAPIDVAAGADAGTAADDRLETRGSNGVSDAHTAPPASGGNSDDDGANTLVFHYNRERRLAKASEAVRRTYTEGYTPNKGFVKGLTANAGLRSTLAVIVILCAAIILVSVFGPSESDGLFCGVPVHVRAFVFDETLFVAVSFDRTDSLPEEFPAAVKAEVTAFDSERNPSAVASVFGIYSGGELVLRCSAVDYDFTTVGAAVSFLDPPDGGETESAVLSAKVKRE